MAGCKWCGAETQKSSNGVQRKFCSRSCSMNYSWNKPGAKRKRAEVATFTCETCGAEFTMLESVRRERERRGDNIRFCSHACCGIAAKKAKLVACAYCGREFEATRKRFCSVECVSAHAKETGVRRRSGKWDEKGYTILYVGKKNGKKEHIVVMEAYVGRKLMDDEVVHHINGDKKDNRIENLRIMARAEHASYHRRKTLHEKEQGNKRQDEEALLWMNKRVEDRAERGVLGTTQK